MRLGDTVRITFNVTVEGALTDPLELSITLRDGAKVDTTYTKTDCTRVSAGIYQLDVVLDESRASGAWVVRAKATGAVVGSNVYQFQVKDLWA
jgi:uncharacterized protein YfaS (alpha-2-macroglobulin family)